MGAYRNSNSGGARELKFHEPKRILFIRSNDCRADSRIQKETQSLAKMGAEISILAWDRDSSYSLTLQQTNNISIYRIGIKAKYSAGLANIAPLARFQLAIFTFLLQHKDDFDYIHACDFDTAFMAFFVAKLYKKHIIYDIFDYYIDTYSVPTILKKPIQYIDTFIINHCYHCIICSLKRKEQILPAKPKRLSIIHNCPSRIEIPPIATNHTNIIKIAYVGVLVKDRYIEEVCEMVSQNSDFELHIAGFGILQHCVQSYAKRYDNISFYGQIPYQQTLELEARCDIMTALYATNIRNHIFAAPNKFYESLMLNKPVIMIKGSGMSEIVEEHDIGAVIDFSITNLANAVRYLHNHETDAKKETRKALYDKFFSWQIMEERLFSLYGGGYRLIIVYFFRVDLHIFLPQQTFTLHFTKQATNRTLYVA